MGLFDLLSKEGRQAAALKRNTTKVVSKYAQSPDRFAAMEALAKDGSEDALYGLCKRFTFKYDKSIEDEQEKNWVVQTLTGKGASAIPAVRRYAKEADTLSWALRILENIAAPEKVIEVIDELLEKEDPGYTRDPGRKLELLSFLGEWHAASHVDIAKRIVPYVADFDQNVRFQALVALSHHPAEDVAREGVLAAMVRKEEEARRIKVKAAEILAEHGWKVTSRKPEVEPMLTGDLSDFTLQNDVLKKKGK